VSILKKKGFRMTLNRSLLTFSIGCAWLISSSFCFAAAFFEPDTVGYSSFSGAYLPLWIAVEERLGRKHGIDLRAICAGRIRLQQLLASGEVPFVTATGTGALTSHILGVKDQVMVLVTVNKVNSAIFSRSDIKSAEELRGKTVATGRPGATGYVGSETSVTSGRRCPTSPPTPSPMRSTVISSYLCCQNTLQISRVL
jgi:ABC-type nitrate/sulfonate/bicarbonate transport system substrate-binding protein